MKARRAIALRGASRSFAPMDCGPATLAILLAHRSRNVCSVEQVEFELGTHQGKPAWRERGVTVAAQQTGALDKAVHAASLKAAKGSVGEPHKPEAHARPRRGG